MLQLLSFFLSLAACSSYHTPDAQVSRPAIEYRTFLCKFRLAIV